LSDFGISTGYTPGKLNIETVGTHDYMAPEVLIGKPYDSKSADIFSLGIILTLIYTSIHPFRCVFKFVIIRIVAMKIINFTNN